MFNLHKFGFFKHKAFLEFWGWIAMFMAFSEEGHRNSILTSDLQASKDVLAFVVMVLLQIPGFADPTINDDGSPNGKVFSNQRGSDAWIDHGQPASFQESGLREQPAVLTEDIKSVMYSKYKQCNKLLWTGEFDKT